MSTTIAALAQAGRPARIHNLPIGYLRGFIIALVVACHAVLAYHPLAPPPPASLNAVPHWWQAFPVVDPERWSGAAAFFRFNEGFLMALMFLISGLFVWTSLKSKGASAFLRNRLFRLGIPFLLLVAIVAPLAYYPTYLQMAGHAGFGGFLANGCRSAYGPRVRAGSYGCCWRSIPSPWRCSCWPRPGATRLDA